MSSALATPALCGGFKPSPGLEPGTASFPSKFGAGNADTSGTGRPRKPRNKKETAADD